MAKIRSRRRNKASKIVYRLAFVVMKYNFSKRQIHLFELFKI